MKLGFVSAILPDLSLPKVVQLAAETGYTCVEFMCWPSSKADRRYAGITHIDVTDFGQGQAAEVEQIVAGAGLRNFIPN